MTTVASRELRNHTADVLRKVANGDPVTITVNGTPVAVISPIANARRPFFTKAESRELLTKHLSDPELRNDLADLAGDTTDDLGPIR